LVGDLGPVDVLPDPTPTPTREDDMAVAIRINDPQWPQYAGLVYLTDGVSKVPVGSVEALDELIAAGAVRLQSDGSKWRDVSMAAARIPMSADEFSLFAMPQRVVAEIAKSRPQTITQETPA
jgi:hypothetical protein